MSRIASRDPSLVRVTGRLSRSDLLWVANTAHGAGGHWHARVHGGEPDHDHLASAETATRYLVDHGLPIPQDPPSPEALWELRIIRTMVARLQHGDDAWTSEGRALLASATYGLDSRGGIGSTQTGWAGFCRDLLLPLLDIAGDRQQLQRCSNPACRLLFLDASRNHSRRWCDTTGCGNRDRVYRARHAGEALPDQ